VLYFEDIDSFLFIVKEREPIRLETEIIAFEKCRKGVADILKNCIRDDFDVYTKRDDKTLRFVLPETTDRISYNSFINKINKVKNGVGGYIPASRRIKILSDILKAYNFKISGSFVKKEIKLEFLGFREITKK
jgi:hypothetical protein